MEFVTCSLCFCCLKFVVCGCAVRAVRYGAKNKGSKDFLKKIARLV